MAATTRTRSWLSRHRQRLAYALIAVSTLATFATATTSGILLHHAAVIQRQTLRTQSLGEAVLRLQSISETAVAAHTVSSSLAAEHRQALAAARAAFANIRAHDPGEADRLEPALGGLLAETNHAFARAAGGGGLLPAEQQRVRAALNRLETVIAGEVSRQGHGSEITTPRARAALIATAVSAGLLVALLVWQFELERRAGRIDRDNAARAAELIRLRDEFVAVVSHELRTPLTSILGYLELILEDDADNLTPEQRDYLATVQRGTNRLTDLVGDLLLVAEAERGLLALELTEVDLTALALDAIEAARPSADAKGVALTLAADGPAPIRGDKRRLGQMLDNLVSNAIKFTPDGGRVEARTICRDDQTRFEISDTGRGIAPEDREQLFEPFFRSATAPAHSVPGTGLGLSITKAIVEAHGGTIEVESRPGAGTTFRVGMPALQPAEALSS